MSRIEWTDETWNPTVGCSLVSPGCTNCYAMKTAHRGLRPEHRGLTQESKGGPVWNGTVRLLPERLEQPLRWRKPRRVFVDSMSDLFHEEVPFDFIDRVFAVMALTPQHTYQILTKRPERMRFYMNDTRPSEINRIANSMSEPPDNDLAWHAGWPLPNVHLGTSVEDQKRADERIPPLLQTPAALRFLSVEPLLGPVDISSWIEGVEWSEDHGGSPGDFSLPGIDWIIVGGESGPGARPCNVEWIRDVVRQCREADVPCFVKQLGSYAIDDQWDDGWQGDEARFVTRDSKGGDPREWPEDLRVREEPRGEEAG